MKELTVQQQTLKRRIFLYYLASYLHSWILPMIGAFMISFFFDNHILCLTGCGIFLYALIAGISLIIPDCDKHSGDLIKEQIQLEDRFKRIIAINQSLDERRDLMLFNEDSHYWKILEDLAA